MDHESSVIRISTRKDGEKNQHPSLGQASHESYSLCSIIFDLGGEECSIPLVHSPKPAMARLAEARSG